jgi:glutathione S-transferase
MSQPIVYGPAISTYVRSVRLALQEKGVEHKLVEVDILKGAQKQSPHIERQPFGKVPAFEHDGHSFYEVAAVLRYVDESFGGPSLTPNTPIARARMTQFMSIVDSYGYQPAIHGLFIPTVLVPSLGGEVDKDKVAAAREPAKLFATVLEKLLGNQSFFVGEQVTLADLHTLPVLTYLAATQDGKVILEKTPKLRSWLGRMGQRPSVKAIMPS